MISCQDFFNILKEKGFTFFTGIPDSTFKNFLKFIADNDNKCLQNLIACNECESIALSAGYYLATNKIAVVYMQNSGLGKAVNPLTSLCDPDVYSIPVLLMIGWRGEPEKNDAPQHKKMGRIMLSLLETLEIPYSILKPDLKYIESELNKAIEYFNTINGPYAFIIRSDFFQKYEMKTIQINNCELTREEAIELIMDNLNENEIIISTTGYTSREVYEFREKREKDHFKSFYNIGSMGCASSIGLSIAIQKPNKKIIVFDGDGATIMQMGTFTTIGKNTPANFVHIIFDNHVHETTGGQPSNSISANFLQIALACNYKYGKIVRTKTELFDVIKVIKNKEGPLIIAVQVKMGTRPNLKRPEKAPKYYKENLLKFLTKLK